MTVEILLLVATTLIALVAVIAAFVAIRAVRRLEHQASQPLVEVRTNRGGTSRGEAVGDSKPPADVVSRLAVPAPASSIDLGPAELSPRIVQGRVIVPPTQAQVVRTALGRPGVRLSVFAHGLARALRPENRDRILSLMRREFRHRRRERLRAGRLAMRTTRPAAAPSTERLRAEFAEPRPLSLTERMIGS
jgi:hypothetical protein